MSQDTVRPGPALLYTRADCPLCFVLRRSAYRAAWRHGLRLRIIDIDVDPNLRARYDTEVPVLALPDGTTLRGRVSAAEVEMAFTRAAEFLRRPVRGTPGSDA